MPCSQDEGFSISMSYLGLPLLAMVTDRTVNSFNEMSPVMFLHWAVPRLIGFQQRLAGLLT